MKFYVNTKDLAGAMAVVTKALPSSATNELLTGIYISAYDNTLYLKCFDLSMMIETTIPAVVEDEGSVVMPGKLTSDLISKLRADTVDFESERNTMKIKCGRMTGNIQFYDAEDYPKGSEYIEEKIINIKQNLLRAMIKQTIFCVATEETSKPVLKGVLLDFTADGVLNMVALDGIRIAIRSEEFGAIGYSKSVVVPAKALKEMSNILSDTDDEIGLILANTMAIIETGDTRISARLIEDEYINYRNILPKNVTARIVADKEQLQQVAETAALAAQNISQKIIKMHFDKEEVKIESNSEIANIIDFADIAMTGDAINIALNSQYFSEVLKAITDESIVINLNTSLTPCVIKPSEGNKFFYMLLPVRVFYND